METNTSLNRLQKKYSSDEQEFTNQQYKVLVVEDNKILTKLYTAYLKDLYFVDIAYNGRDALTKIFKTPPHLILLDIMMPDLDGFSVAQKLHENKINIPVIVITAKHLSEGEIELLQSLGISSHFQKDELSQERLLSEIQKYIPL